MFKIGAQFGVCSTVETGDQSSNVFKCKWNPVTKRPWIRHSNICDANFVGIFFFPFSAKSDCT